MAEKFQETGAILKNERIADGMFWLQVKAPEIARHARPGQFVHVRVTGPSVQFLRMPFAVYDVTGRQDVVDICYQVLGEGTRQLSGLSCGDELDLIGPIGNGWSVPSGAKHALMIAGGVGVPALNLLGRQMAADGIVVDAVMGALNEERLCCVDHIEQATKASGGTLHITTDDGSVGTKGFVTAVSDELIASGAYDYVAICGPLPMEKNAARPALENDVPCQVSMEKLMACGVGACLSCVVDTVAGRKRCCVDGPVFEAAEVIW